ncbi:hypothetical protein KIH07_04770 [Hydrogenophaga taeniospiralis]|uniref:hypothetical protein n=1 Tax=Hydrogenophaga taeniospiralis TaxID=65656 RepID=UPI001CFA3799|nr:hypothetical protein [Hydrogenophaga taeniospiralis]MCB4363034.1 hypothetical protein [Hydrogenophaga taeniospiralis]
MQYPATSARLSLASRFGLPYSDDMQDWEWQVADSQRFQEFLLAYRSAKLTDDERFSLMEILVQCVEDLGLSSHAGAVWADLEPLLVKDLPLHRTTIEYWSCRGEVDPESKFNVSPQMRKVSALLDR